MLAHIVGPLTVIDDQGRPEPDAAVDERGTLLGFLDYRARHTGVEVPWGRRGRNARDDRDVVDDTRRSVEAHGAGRGRLVLEGVARARAVAPWNAVDWDADPDWEWRTAADDTPEELFALWNEHVERSRVNVEQALASPAGFDQISTLACFPMAARPACAGSSCT